MQTVNYTRFIMNNTYKKSEAKGKKETDRNLLWIKVLLWVFVIALAGIVLCAILGALKWAIETCLIIACVLIIICLIGVVIYNKVRYRMSVDRYNRAMRKRGDGA